MYARMYGDTVRTNSTLCFPPFSCIQVGEWLKYTASPLERKHFEEFVQLLDEFEYNRGIQLQKKSSAMHDGVVINLGPMLHAKVTFHVC